MVEKSLVCALSQCKKQSDVTGVNAESFSKFRNIARNQCASTSGCERDTDIGRRHNLLGKCRERLTQLVGKCRCPQLIHHAQHGSQHGHHVGGYSPGKHLFELVWQLLLKGLHVSSPGHHAGHAL